MNLGLYFAAFKWTHHRIFSRELCSFHNDYVDFLRGIQLAPVLFNSKLQKFFKTPAPRRVLVTNTVWRNKHEGCGFMHQKSFRRNFSKYVSPNKNSIYFDTHLMVTDLTNSGFTLKQSEVITSAITDIVHSAVGNVKGDSVSRVEQEQLEVRLKSLIEKVRNDMIILEKTEFVRMKDECEKLKSEVASLKLLLQDEVVKLKSNQALDTSLERSRVKEEFQFRDQKIKDNNNRIDTELARVETKIEAQKLDLLKYLVGSVLSLTTISLAFWRFFRM